MFNIEDLWHFNLRRLNTDHPRNDGCLMDAARWIVYREIGDNPECACPIIRAYAIRINDMLPDDERQRLKRFILRVVGNRDPESEQARAEYLVKQTAGVILPIGLEAEAVVLMRLASILGRHVSDIKVTTITSARGAVAALRRAEANVGADWVSAAAVGDTAWKVIAAIHAAGNASVRQQVYDAAIEMLDGVLNIGKQANPVNGGEVCLAIQAFERARRIECEAA